MKRIVVFGGGSGLSQLLKGLKLFPVEITAVVSVADNGSSTGKLRKEFHIPAVGDISKVMLSMSNVDDDIKDLMNYRFSGSKDLANHSIKNLLLTALLDIKGNFADALPVLGKILDLKGDILPFTEDNVNLIGYTESGKKIFGEVNISNYQGKIIKLGYDKEYTVNPKIISKIKEADLIVFSMGSLLTSIIPNLIDKKIVNEIKRSKADKMYICNLFTQPNETDGFTVSDHINELEKYLGKNVINVVVANNEAMSSSLAAKYATKEQKDPVILDLNKLQKRNIKVISDKLYTIENDYYRHDSLKVGYLIFSHLMDKK